MEEKWIPVKWHRMTREENIKRGYPEEWKVFDCEMPKNGEEICITVDGYGCNEVMRDICVKYADEDTYYLESGYSWYQEVIAWMPCPLPKPYEGE